ncbi:MAG: hypothetical protein J6S67_01675 [Methanobrevibacter sp.]|nr:hypothetical protein [Methanobrevibacter sp.]
MDIILVNKNDFQIDQYSGVTNIAYNAGTGIYTITYGSPSQTTSYDGAIWALSVLYK